MSILGRYLVGEFLLSSSAVLLGLLVTWLASDSLRHLDELAGGAAGGLARIALTALDVLPYGVPLACIIGVVWTLARAVRSREITAIRAGGIPLQRALLPLLGSALGIALGLALLTDRVVVPGRVALSEAPGESDESRDARPRFLAGRHWFARGASLFSMREFQAARGLGHDVTVLRLDDQGRLVERIDAREARHVAGETWEFRDARIRGFDPGKPGLAYREAEVLRLDLGLDESDLARALPAAQELSLHRLTRAIREHPPDTLDARGRAALQAALHGRLLEPLSVVLLVLLAIPFGLGDVERGDSLPRALLLALVWALGFWVAWATAVFIAQQGVVPPFVPLWSVSLGALAIGLWRYRRIKE